MSTACGLGTAAAGGARSALWSAAERCGYAERETLLLAPRAVCLLVPSREHLEVLRGRFGGHAPATFEVPIGLNVGVATERSRPGPGRGAARARRGAGAPRWWCSSVSCIRTRRSTG